MMFYTMAYKHGWIQYSYFRETGATYAARSPGRILGDYKSELAAKLAIARDAKARAADRSQAMADHVQAIRDIWEGPRHV